MDKMIKQFVQLYVYLVKINGQRLLRAEAAQSTTKAPAALIGKVIMSIVKCLYVYLCICVFVYLCI